MIYIVNLHVVIFICLNKSQMKGTTNKTLSKEELEWLAETPKLRKWRADSAVNAKKAEEKWSREGFIKPDEPGYVKPKKQ